MKYLNLCLTVLVLALVAIAWKLHAITAALQDARDTSQLVTSSNQALIKAHASLESEIIVLRKQVEAVKESFPKR